MTLDERDPIVMADTGPLIRLASRYRAANRSLAAVARAGSLSPFPATTPATPTTSLSR